MEIARILYNLQKKTKINKIGQKYHLSCHMSLSISSEEYNAGKMMMMMDRLPCRFSEDLKDQDPKLMSFLTFPLCK